jgi:hypothetical protein
VDSELGRALCLQLQFCLSCAYDRSMAASWVIDVVCIWLREKDPSDDTPWVTNLNWAPRCIRGFFSSRTTYIAPA